MQYQPTWNEAEIRAALEREATESFGPERAAELSSGLAEAARALWTVGAARLELVGDEPDYGV